MKQPLKESTIGDENMNTNIEESAREVENVNITSSSQN